MELADGISGTLDNLSIDDMYKSDTEGIPVDMLLIDLTGGVDEVENTDSTII